MKTAAIYVRVSTREQATENHFSIPEQTRRLKDYCNARDLLVYKIYVDPGHSGSNLERPGMNELLKDISKGNIDTVLVYKLDRLSRSQKDTLFLIEDIFMANNISFISLQENFDTSTAFGRAAVGILSCFAQLEREQIKERSLMGREAKAREGYFHGGGYAPIGYNYVDGNLTINEYEAMQVREVYKLYLEGFSIYNIWTSMRDKKYTTQHGSYKSETTIRSILDSPIYAGWISWKGQLFKGRHTPIVSQEIFDKVQKRRDETRKQNKNRHIPFTHTTLLGGFLWCGHCGARYYCKQQNSKRANGKSSVLKYYKCYSRGKTNKNFILDPNCKSKTFRVEKLDAVVLEEIRKLALDPSTVLKLKTEHNDLTVPNKIETLEKRISEIKKQTSKLMDLYSLDNISFEDISEKLTPLSEEKKFLEVELEKLKSENKSALELNETYKILKTVPKILNSNSLQDKRNLLESLIHKIVIIGDEINIEWKFL